MAEDAVEEANVEVSVEDKSVLEMDGAQKPLEPDLPQGELYPDLPLHHHLPTKPQKRERPEWGSQVEQLKLLPWTIPLSSLHPLKLLDLLGSKSKVRQGPDLPQDPLTPFRTDPKTLLIHSELKGQTYVKEFLGEIKSHKGDRIFWNQKATFRSKDLMSELKNVPFPPPTNPSL